jgi:Ca-activated chloride channel family protein
MNKQLTVVIKSDAELIAREIPTSRVLEVVITAPESGGQKQSPPLNLGLVIDRSGSMGSGKLEQAKFTVERILGLMREKDRVSIVAFDDQITTLANGVLIDAATRQSLIADIAHLHTGGSTNLGDGWLTGCNCVAGGQDSLRVNRTLLLSDGQANVGMVDAGELAHHASELFERGITTSTFGIGEGFDEHLMEGMANRGGGNFFYIRDAESLQDILMQEFADLMTVTARKVEVELNFPAGVSAELLGEWRSEKHARKITVSLSDLSADRVTNLFVKLLTPPGDGQLVVNAVVTYINEDDQKQTATSELTLQYATEEKTRQAKTDQDLVQRYSAVAVGGLMNEALKMERSGKRDDAQKLMLRTLVEHNQSMPAPTRERYAEVASRINRGLQENERKSLQSDSYMLKKHRHPDEQRPEKKE